MRSALVLVAASVLLTGGCGGNEGSGEQAPTQTVLLEKVTVVES